jgi:arylsulfatase A-like enzyme/tetratricopeptide (TPR) repeat protein
MITLDTTRADRLGCYGYERALTPRLDALASSGVVFDRAVSVAPLTLPAHASLFTGLYPVETGLFTNARGRLPDSIPTLAEVLKRRGYDTAGFVASFVLNRKFGLDRGFTKYDDDFDSDEPAPDALHRQRSAAAVVDSALAWLAEKRSKPFFCWVHFYDPHAPYLKHSDLFNNQFDDSPYDAEIAYVDLQVGRLLDFIQAQGLDSHTLVVVVGDHGEGLGEHIERTHGSTLYNATQRVPLIFRLPATSPAGSRVAASVSQVDVFPTVLELLGIHEPRQTSGISFRQALFGKPQAAHDCYSTTDEPFLLNACSPLRSLTDGSWKYIRTTKPELYDLARDEHEFHNLAGDRPDVLRDMDRRLHEFEARLVPGTAVDVQLSAAERRVLASLGYVGGAAAPESASTAKTDLPDVKDMLPIDIAVEEAVDLLNRGSADAAIGRLRQIIRQAPSHTAAYRFLGDALREQKQYDEASAVFQELLDLRPDSSGAHFGLGNVLVEGERLPEAISEFEKAVEITPDFAEAHYNLATAFVRTGRPDEALAHFDVVIEQDGRHALAYQGRANLLVSLGRVDRAIADYRLALQYDPAAPDTNHNLGVVLADRGDVEGARRHLARAVELSPGNAQLQYTWGAFLAQQHEYDEAARHLEESLRLRPDDPATQARLDELRQLARPANN